jgi:hypothetical protein
MQCKCTLLCLYTSPLWVYNIFSTLYHLRFYFFLKKSLLNIKLVFWFCLQDLSKISLIIRRIQPDIIINSYRSSRSAPVITANYKEIWIFSTDFRKYSNIKYYGNPFSWVRVILMRTEGRQTDMKKLAVSFRNCGTRVKYFYANRHCRLNQMYNQLWQTYKNTHYMKNVYPPQSK